MQNASCKAKLHLKQGMDLTELPQIFREMENMICDFFGFFKLLKIFKTLLKLFFHC